MPEVNFAMDLADPQFWLGLGQIIIVNILLSGDNAVVIALASRSLPPEHRRIAVFGGSAGAVVLRIIFTFVIAWLLTIPFLKVVGGLALLWIGAQLMAPEDGHGEDGIKAHSGLWPAMQTIIIADAVMSLDNVIAIAAAAKGNFPLLLIGLLISIPLVVFGSLLFLKLLDRFPILVVAGAGLLGWIAGEVMVTDPIVEHWINENAPWLHLGGAIIGVGVVLGAGWLIRRRAEAKARSKDVEDIAVEKH